MPSILEELLDNPKFGAVIVAAKDAIPTRAACTAVHLTDLPDPTQWLRGGEIILTTGIGLGDSTELQDSFVRRLAELGCIALGYSGYDLEPLPEAMVAAAEEVGLPLFVVDYSVPLVDVTMFITSRILDRHYVRMRQGVEVHRKIMRAVSGNAQLETILPWVCEARPGVDLSVIDYFGRVIARCGDDPFDVPSREIGRSRVEPREPQLHRDITVDGRRIRLWTLCLGGQVEGFFACAADNALDDIDTLLLEHAMAGVVFVLSRDLSQRQLRRTAVADLLEALRNTSASDVRLGELIRRVELDPQEQHVVMCLPCPDSVRVTDLCRIVEDHLPAAAAVGAHGREVCAIAPHPVTGTAEALHMALSALVGEVRVGTSPPRIGVDGLQLALKQSSSAARFAPRPSGVFGIEDVGIAAMFGSEDPALRELVIGRVLGPLITADEADSSQLLPSLRAFILHGCRPGQAATQLYIHRHTLAYRLDKIAKLTGRDPRLGEYLLDYTLALSLYEQRSGHSLSPLLPDDRTEP